MTYQCILAWGFWIGVREADIRQYNATRFLSLQCMPKPSSRLKLMISYTLPVSLLDILCLDLGLGVGVCLGACSPRKIVNFQLSECFWGFLMIVLRPHCIVYGILKSIHIWKMRGSAHLLKYSTSKLDLMYNVIVMLIKGVRKRRWHWNNSFTFIAKFSDVNF